jgi:hypothetical protein
MERGHQLTAEQGRIRAGTYMKNVWSFSLGSFSFFMGWNTSSVAITKFAWYGNGVQLGQLLILWERSNECAADTEQSDELFGADVPSYGDIQGD